MGQKDIPPNLVEVCNSYPYPGAVQPSYVWGGVAGVENHFDYDDPVFLPPSGIIRLDWQSCGIYSGHVGIWNIGVNFGNGFMSLHATYNLAGWDQYPQHNAFEALVWSWTAGSYLNQHVWPDQWIIFGYFTIGTDI